MPDTRKGEQIILVTTQADADRQALLAFAQEEGFPELWLPKAIMVVEVVPATVLGKTDYVATTTLVQSLRPML